MVLTNRCVLTFLVHHNKSETVDWLLQLCNSNETESYNNSLPSRRAFDHRISSVIAKDKQLKKNISKTSIKDTHENFLTESFIFPKTWHNRPRCNSAELVDPSPSTFITDCHAEAAYKLSTELTSVKTELAQTKDLSKKNRCEDLLEHEEQVTALSLELKELKEKNGKKTAELKRTVSRENYCRHKVQKLEQESIRKADAHTEIQSNEHEQTFSDLEEKLQNARIDINYLQSLLQTEASDTVSFYDERGKKYSDKLMLCVYQLLDNNVATSKVSAVISSVLALVDKKAERLPCAATVKNMNISRLLCSQRHIADECKDKVDTCLMSDETSKFGKKIQGFHLSDTEGTPWVLGVRDLESKSSQHVLNAFKEVLLDIDTSAKTTQSDVAKHLLCNISATMADKAATEAKFHKLLEEYRLDILPEVVENYHELPQSEQHAISSLHNFFCGLHSLVHMAEGANAALVETETGFFPDAKPIYDKSFQKSKESGAARLVRTASKAVSRGGDESAGCYGPFMDVIAPFLKEKKVNSLPLLPYRGHRFNILFSNCAALFFLHEELLKFLTHFQGNRLLKAVLYDLQVPEYLAGVKCLGLVSKFITEPLWSMIERKNIHILDMNTQYQTLLEFLKKASEKPSEFVSGKMLVFEEDAHVHKDAILDSLLEPWEHDDKVEIAASVVLSSLAKVAEQQFRDHLVDGKWNGLEQDDRTRRTSASVPKHNKFAETVFGFFDQLTRTKPSISSIAAEAYTMFTMNKTAAWLHGKHEEELKEILSTARLGVAAERTLFKERQMEIKNARRRQTEEKMAKDKEAKQRRIQKLENYTRSMIEFGLWQTQDDVDKKLSELTDITSKKEALKAQLNFRKHVFGQEAAKSIYTFTVVEEKTRRQLTVEELTKNLKTLISSAFQRDASLSKSILVGQKVKHWFLEEGDGIKERVCYVGRVLSQVPGYPSWHNIKYDDDDNIYTYELLKDQEAGDLEVLV